MTATPSPEELATKLEEHVGMLERDGWFNVPNDLRAAAALIRELVSQQKELREALTPFADWAAHHRQSTHDHYVPECEIDGPGHSLTLILGDFRRAAKALEPK